MDKKDVLIAARELISEESRWTKGEAARSKDGSSVDPNSPLAVCWCAVGAIEKIAGLNTLAFWHAQDSLRMKSRINIAEYNDKHSHKRVLALFDRAIAACGNE